MQDKKGHHNSASSDAKLPKEESGNGLVQAILKVDRAVAGFCSKRVKQKGTLYSNLVYPLAMFIENSGHGIPWLIIAIIPLFYDISFCDRATGLSLLLGMIVDLIAVGTIKPIARRPRPRIVDDNQLLVLVSVDHYSFPSGHSSRAMFLALFGFAFFNDSLGWFLAIWAVLICASRILLVRHNVSDVVAGLVLGWLEYVFVFAYLPPTVCEQLLPVISAWLGRS